MTQNSSIPDIKTVSAKPPALSGISTIGGNRFFDNSTLDSMRVCPRRFYYSKIRKWKQDRDSIALLFGSAWHACMDFVWANPSASIEKSFQPFQNMWDSSEFVDTESFDTFPRTPQRARDMLSKYKDRYQSWLENNITVEAIEASFIVPLSETQQNLFYIGKWDKVYKEGMFYHIVDHKTTSSFSTSWLNSWSPNGQVDGYLFAGHMTYGDLFKSVMIDGALVQKTSIDFKRIPVERQTDMLDQWKWEVLDLIEQIIYYEDRLKEIRANGSRDSFLKTFPKCTTSCTSYYGSCPYLDLCKFVPNPEIYDINNEGDIPNGYAKDTWQAFAIEESPTGEFTAKPHIGGE